MKKIVLLVIIAAMFTSTACKVTKTNQLEQNMYTAVASESVTSSNDQRHSTVSALNGSCEQSCQIPK